MIILRGKILKVQRNETGPLFETLFVARGSDLADPQWTRDEDEAAILDYGEADARARELGSHCHALVVSGREQAAMSAVERARAPVPEPVLAAREERALSYQAEMERRGWA